MKLLEDEEIARLQEQGDINGVEGYEAWMKLLLKAQAKLTRQEDYEWLISQLYGSRGRMKIFHIDCDELDSWREGEL